MRFCGRNCVQAARKPNSVLDDHSSRRGVTDALDSNLPAGFDSCFHTSLRLTATGRCVISPEEWAMISLPIWSCSVWGLPSRRHYCRRGGLLPHRFTLTAESYMGRFLSRPAQISEAVCFLLHWPSSGVETGIPDVIRHTTLRSSDFPPPRSLALPRQRSSGRLHLVPVYYCSAYLMQQPFLLPARWEDPRTRRGRLCHLKKPPPKRCWERLPNQAAQDTS